MMNTAYPQWMDGYFRKVAEAFNDQRPPKSRLLIRNDCQCATCSEVRHELSGLHWKQLSESQLTLAISEVDSLSNIALRFFLPALIIHSCSQDGSLLKTRLEPGICLVAQRLAQLSDPEIRLFSLQQRNLILRFLNYAAKGHACDVLPNQLSNWKT